MYHVVMLIRMVSGLLAAVECRDAFILEHISSLCECFLVLLSGDMGSGGPRMRLHERGRTG
jgi:hypothetical protein